MPKFNFAISINPPGYKNPQEKEPVIIIPGNNGGNSGGDSLSHDLDLHISASDAEHATLQNNITIVNDKVEALTTTVNANTEAINGKADVNHTHNYDELENKPVLDFAPSNHNHDNLYALADHTHDNVYAIVNHNHDTLYAPVNHSHSEYVTADDVTTAINAAVSGAFKFMGEVDELPASAEVGAVYQVDDKEYAYTANGSWVELGYSIDLSNYVTVQALSELEETVNSKAAADDLTALETEVNATKSLVNEKANATEISAIESRVGDVESALTNKADASALDGYVEKAEGKALSDNNFSNEDKEKLDNLSNYDDTDINAGLEALRNSKNTDTAYFVTIISKLRREVDALRRAANVTVSNQYNPVIVTVEEGQLVASDNTEDVIVSNQNIDTKSTVTVKSLDVDNAEIDITYNTANAISIDAQEDISITNTTIESDNPEQKSSNMIRVTSAEVLKLDGVSFSGATYNTIMTGQSTSEFLKYIDILNCDFNEDAKHVNIWIGGWADKAVCNIKNCHFNKMEQVLILGDGHLVNGVANELVINIEDCVIDDYDRPGKEGITANNLKYQGIIGCEAFNNGANKLNSLEAINEFNPFGKVTINIKNVTAGGVQLTAADFKMGTQTDGQQIWLCFDKLPSQSNVVYGEDTKAWFPTVYVDGVLVEQE